MSEMIFGVSASQGDESNFVLLMVYFYLSVAGWRSSRSAPLLVHWFLRCSGISCIQRCNWCDGFPSVQFLPPHRKTDTAGENKTMQNNRQGKRYVIHTRRVWGSLYVDRSHSWRCLILVVHQRWPVVGIHSSPPDYFFGAHAGIVKRAIK